MQSYLSEKRTGVPMTLAAYTRCYLLRAWKEEVPSRVREEALDHMGVGLGQGKTAEREEVPGARGRTCLLVVLS